MAGKGQAEGCAACAKWLLIIFNVLFCLLGIGMLAAGIYAYIQLREYFNFLGNPDINVPAILLIVFGCITFIIAALGCVGACKESPCLLFTFAAIIGVLLVAEIAVGIVAFVWRSEAEVWLDDYGIKFLENYNGTDAKGVRASWDFLQNKFECCGVNGPEDYKPMSPPESCKKDKTGPARENGCKDSIVKFIQENIVIAAGVGVGFGIIELLGIVFACCVGCAARKGEYA